MAARALGMETAQSSFKRHIGPADLGREKELAELDAQVQDPDRYKGTRFALAEDCLESALIARGLERPRLEIEARFNAALKFARESGIPKQILRVLYNKAWSLFWWQNDANYVDEAYDEIEQLVFLTNDAADAELLQNLWMLLFSSAGVGRLQPEKARVAVRLSSLKSHLDLIIGNAERPNNALNARSAMQLLRISELQLTKKLDEIDEIWEEFRDIISSSKTHPGYSLARLNDLIGEIGEFVPESRTFDLLTDDLAEAFSAQHSAGEGGKVYLRRGLQKLDKDLHFDAIVMLGKAEPMLAALDHREDLIQAQLGISQAYQQAGLIWAARNKALLACDRLLSTIAGSAEIDPRTLVALKHLAWLETRLGRVPHLLSIIGLMEALEDNARLPDRAKKMLAENRIMQEGALSIELLSADLTELEILSKLPDGLSRLGLEWARLCLLWALGQTQSILDEGYLPEGEGLEELAVLMKKANDQPAKKDLPPMLYLGEGRSVSLQSTILGCSFRCSVQNDRSTVCLAEMVLGAMESFLATSLETRSLPYREDIELIFQSADLALNCAPSLDISETDSSIRIQHNYDDLLGGAAAWSALVEWLTETVIAISVHVLAIEDHKAWLERIAGKEDGFNRAIALNQVAIATENLFGPAPSLTLGSHIHDGDNTFALMRDELWNARDENTELSDGTDQELRPGKGPAPEGMFDRATSRHDEHKVISVIDLPQWDRAKWCATGFALVENFSIPFVGLAFENLDAGKRIFEGWRVRFGEVDEKESIRVSIIRGIDRENPHHYRVVVSANVRAAELHDNQRMLVMTARINTMTPDSPQNLVRLMEEYRDAGQYILAPMGSPHNGAPELVQSIGILKRELIIKEAFEIGLNEPEVVGIRQDDNPIIPDGILNAPVLEVLERAKEMRRAGNFEGQ